MKRKIKKSIVYFLLIAVIGTFFLKSLISYYSKELPSINEIIEYNPKTISKVFDRNGKLFGVFFDENREYVPIQRIPKLVQYAFISAEDKNFYEHSGYDVSSLIKALIDFLKGGKLRGASTITQQVTKGFLLSGERSFERKVQELILAVKLEKALSKDEILEIYLNEVYLGEGTHGVSAAASVYFSKSLDELKPREAAFLASLPKLPAAYNPKSNRRNAIQRRNFVLTEMAENGYISTSKLNSEVKFNLETVQSGEISGNVISKKFEGLLAEDIMAQITRLLGERSISQGGLSIKTSIDLGLQEIVRTALESELENLDVLAKSFRPPIAHIESIQLVKDFDLRDTLEKESISKLNIDWDIGVVLKVSGENVTIVTNRSSEIGKLHLIEDASPELKVGDVIYVKDVSNGKFPTKTWRYKQRPLFDGGIVVSDLKTGEVLALEGGYSYQFNATNKITEAKQPRLKLLKPILLASVLRQIVSSDKNFPNISANKIDLEADEQFLLNHLSLEYEESHLKKITDAERQIMETGLEINQVLFDKASLGILMNLGLAEKSSNFPNHIKIRDETTIIDIMSAYSVFMTNIGQEDFNLLLEVFNDDMKVFSKKPSINLCHSCEEKDKPVVLFKNNQTGKQSSSNKINKKLLQLLTLEYLDLNRELNQSVREIMIGNRSFNQDLVFDSLVGIVGDKIFGCHIEPDQTDFELEPHIISGSCLSLVNRIISHSVFNEPLK